MHTQLMIMADPDNIYPNNSMPSSSFRQPHETGFEVSDFFEFNDWIEEDPAFSPVSPADYNPQNPSYAPNEIMANSSEIGSGISSNNNNFYEGTINRSGSGSGSGREKKEMREKVAFKTKSEVEVLDDGFKWRKYGKKMVKNSPNPRNYYRCSVEGCPVKKRVERDKEDPNYVVTTYEGIHTHQGPQL